MLLDEKIFQSKELSQKIEFITQQSSERREEEVRYKQINRKLIILDLDDTETMLLIGKELTFHGLYANFERKMVDSKIACLRIWAENRIIRHAQEFIRMLYLKHPEKFAEVQHESAKRKKMTLLKASYILSEQVSQKSISLKDVRDDDFNQLDELKERFINAQKHFFQQESTVKDLTHNNKELEQSAFLEMKSMERK